MSGATGCKDDRTDTSPVQELLNRTREQIVDVSVLQPQDALVEERMVTRQGPCSERIFERVDVDPVPRIWNSMELVWLIPRERVQ